MRKNKFNAKKTTVDGITFDSKKEANRYSELKLLEKTEQIHKLELQPAFKFFENGKLIFTYRADFSYFSDTDWVIEDVKGFKTPLYKLKKKLIEARYPGLEIVEV